VLDDFSRYILARTRRTSMGDGRDGGARSGPRGVRCRSGVRRPPPSVAERQWPLLRLGGAGDVSRDQRLRLYARRAVSPDDPRQDRTVPSLAEECRQARSLLQPVGIGARLVVSWRRTITGGSRVAAERDAGGCLLRPTGGDPVAS
jgi:hypothetical protein